MKRIEPNPFDRNLQDLPLMRFLLHSNSLASEILSEGSPAHRLLKLNGLDEIEITPLPTTSNEVLSVFIDNGLKPTDYHSHESGVSLKSPDGSLYGVGIQYPKSNLWEPVVSGSSVAWIDMFASLGHRTDYFVVGKSDPFLADESAGDKTKTAEQALELLRILLAAHSRFYVLPKVTIDEAFYYLYRFKKLFASFQHAWTVAVYAHGKTLPEKVYGFLESLGARLEFICRAYDKVAFFSLRTAHIDTQDNALYHLAYLVMLITGAFDDLAHIIKELYRLRINGRRHVSLRIPQDKETTKFYQALESENADLHAILTAAETQKAINAFYPIRDSLQHREFLKGIFLGQGTSVEERKNLFELSDEAAESLYMASGTSKCIVRVHKPCLDPLPFITWSQTVLTGLINKVLSSINWDIVCQDLPTDIQGKILESHKLFEQGVGKGLGWQTEPLYF